jgi:lysophospholipase L1-like esterase
MLTLTRFVAFGDSMTWGEDGSNAPTVMTTQLRIRPYVQLPTPDTYPGALQALLAARYTAQSPQVTNAGKPGEAAADPGTFSRFVSATPASSYDVVLLMEGANDLSTHSTSQIIGALGQMIDNATSRGLFVMLATLPPENPNGFDPTDRGGESPLVPPVNDQIRALAASKSVPLVDVYQAFGGDLSLIGNDGLHPTAAGYHLIAQTFLSSIKQALEPPPGASMAMRARLLSSSSPRR